MSESKKPSAFSRFIALENTHGVLFFLIWSPVLDFIIEWMSRHSFLEACKFVVFHPVPYLFNSYIIFAFYSLAFLFRRRSLIRRIVTGFFVTLGLINCVLLLNRVSPFGFTDLDMIGDLLTMQGSKYFSPWEAVLALVGLGVYIFFLVRIFLHGPDKIEKKKPFPLRLIAVIALFAGLPLSGFGLQKAGLLDSYFGNLAQGYLNNGYLYGFSTSAIQRGISRPIGYSNSAVKEIIKNDGTEESTITGKSGAKNQGPNVIVVLLESFFDPTECNYLSFSEDPIPYVHSLQENYSTGHLKVPVLGAGTCNTEFEVLTGMSCSFFGPGEYPQKTVLKRRNVESFADTFDELGYHSHVVHNNGGNFYSRANAFSRMGFDTFTCKEMLDITDYTPLGSWPTDDILIPATKDALDSTKSSDFVYTITVSTHGNYPDYKVIDNPEVKVTAKGKDEGTRYKWEYYVNQVHTLDTWIKNYVEMLDSRGEDTLLIRFGDHLPTMGLTSSEVKTGDLYQTEYYTWNNFGMPKEDADLAAYQLVSQQTGKIGVHNGTMTKYNQTMMKENVPYGSLRYMSGLKMLQYDLLYGRRYAYNGVNLYPSSDLEMGINDVKIDRAYTFNGKVHLYGENFTKWSKAYVNGEKVSTSYVSGQQLTIDADKVKEGDTIVVSQVGSSDTIFRSSNKYVYSPAEDAANGDANTNETDPSDNTAVQTEISE